MVLLSSLLVPFSPQNSDVLLVVQTKELFQRPWCLLECFTAIKNQVPIVALNCEGKGYDFAEASNLLTHLDSHLDDVNPGASDVLRHEGKVDLQEMAFLFGDDQIAHMSGN